MNIDDFLPDDPFVENSQRIWEINFSEWKSEALKNAKVYYGRVPLGNTPCDLSDNHGETDTHAFLIIPMELKTKTAEDYLREIVDKFASWPKPNTPAHNGSVSDLITQAKEFLNENAGISK